LEKILRADNKERINGLLFLLPGILWIIFIFILPVIQVVAISLTQQKNGQEIFVGGRNYEIVLNDPLLKTAIINNFKLLAIVPLLIFLSLIFSTILYEQLKGWRIYQTVIFIPVILAIAAMGTVFSQLLQLNGLLNEFLRVIGLGFLAQEWLGNQQYALISVIGVIVWKELGFGTILFLAKLMSVERELYEAARIDGANWWQLLRYITIPQLSHVIEFYTVLTVVTAFSFVFDYILILTNSGPNNSTIVGEFFIYKYGFIYNRINLASAVAVIYLIAGILLMIVRYQIVKRLES
jgi:ABC-type sugar transport system permease subunit